MTSKDMAGEAQCASLSDDELVELARSGRSDCFGELVSRHRDRVYGQIYKMLSNKEEALDLSQDVWVKAWSRLHQFQGDSPFTTWVTRIAINVCLDFIRKRQRRPVEDSIEALTERCGDGSWVPAVEDDPLAGLERDEMSEVLNKALDSISEEQRMALKYMYYDQMEYKEIAAKMKCSIGTVMSRLFYGKKALGRQFRMLQARDNGHSDVEGSLQ